MHKTSIFTYNVKIAMIVFYQVHRKKGEQLNNLSLVCLLITSICIQIVMNTLYYQSIVKKREY